MREQVALSDDGGEPRRRRQAADDKKGATWERRLWSTLDGKTAVIVGVGVVGIAIGELLKALGMTVIGVTRTPRAIAGFDEMLPTDRLAEAARRADYLINVLPASTRKPRHLQRRGVRRDEAFGLLTSTAAAARRSTRLR